MYIVRRYVCKIELKLFSIKSKPVTREMIASTANKVLSKHSSIIVNTLLSNRFPYDSRRFIKVKFYLRTFPRVNAVVISTRRFA